MEGPPGQVPTDDQTIRNDQLVLRRVPPGGFKESGRPNSSPNFDLDRSGRGTSVTLWLDEGDSINVLRGHDGYGLVSLSVREWRKYGLTIARAPVDGDPNHCEIWGARTTGVKRKLAAAASWVVLPDDHPMKGSHGDPEVLEP